jgi:hypothetical protein
LQASFQQAVACKAVGAFLSQLCGLPEQQLKHWWYGQEYFTLHLSDTEPGHAAAAQAWLQVCCQGLAGADPLQLDPTEGSDPVAQLLQWLVAAISPRHVRHQKGGQQQQQQEQQEQEQEQEQHQGQGVEQAQCLVHPAEALRQLLDVLLSALQYRHVLSMQQ